MPALPPAANVVRFAMRGTFGDDNDILNIFHVHFGEPGPYVDDDLMTSAGLMAGLYLDAFKSSMGTAWIFQDCTAKDLSVADGAAVVSVDHSGTTGTVATAPVTAGVALVISWKEALSYRGGHPRTYLPAIPQSEILTPQMVQPSFSGALQTAANTFIANIGATSFPDALGEAALSVVHYGINHTPQIPPLVKPILSAIVNQRLDSQRRRNG